MAKKYLKCRYWENMPMTTSPGESLITFKIKDMNKINPSALIGKESKGVEFPDKDEEWCIVKEKNVIFCDGENNSGLVKIIGLTMDETKDIAKVYINNLDGITYFSVPIDEIVVQ